MLLKSKVLKITKLKRYTKAKMLKHLGVGDKIQLSVSTSRAGIGSNNRSYAKYITVRNLATNETNKYTFNQIGILEEVFEWEELN